MSYSFDWTLLREPRWTPLSRFTSTPEEVSQRGLYAVAPCVYLMVNASFGGTVEDPGVGAVMWARNRTAALRIYDEELDDDDAIGTVCELPPRGIIGFEPVTFGAAVRFGKRGGGRPVHSAGYRFSDGRFVVSELHVAGREYVFASANPADDEEPIGIVFRLQEG